MKSRSIVPLVLAMTLGLSLAVSQEAQAGRFGGGSSGSSGGSHNSSFGSSSSHSSSFSSSSRSSSFGSSSSHSSVFSSSPSRPSTFTSSSTSTPSRSTVGNSISSSGSSTGGTSSSGAGRVGTSTWGSSTLPSRASTPPSTVTQSSMKTTTVSTGGGNDRVIGEWDTPDVPRTAAQQQAYESARSQGVAFRSRDDALSDFRRKNAPTFTSQFATEPSQRPIYIPPMYRDIDTGNNYVINYDRSYGGYGWYSGAAWHYYDLWRDAAMLDVMMHHHGYYYGSPPPTVVVTGQSSPVTVVENGEPRSTVVMGNAGGQTMMVAQPRRSYMLEAAVIAGFVVWGVLVVLVVAIILLRRRTATASPEPVAGEPVYRAAAAAAPSRPSAPPAASASVSTASPDFWRQRQVGDRILLSDPATRRQLAVTGRASEPGMFYDISSHLKFSRPDGLMEWRLMEVHEASGGDPLWLKAFIAGDKLDIGVFYEPPADAANGFEPGTRQDLIAAGCKWPFAAPADPEHFDPARLDYTRWFPGTLDDGREVVYEMSLGGAIAGACTQQPDRGGGQEPAVIVEYALSEIKGGGPQPVDDTQCFFLELGDGDQALLKFFRGCLIRPQDVRPA
jgi:hypothetical protein